MDVRDGERGWLIGLKLGCVFAEGSEEEGLFRGFHYATKWYAEKYLIRVIVNYQMALDSK